jgi:(R)-2-hydroxyacyl-CoA dehydratese activating ATPase
MICAGLDIGSRTVKFVLLKDRELSFARKAITSFNPLDTARELMRGIHYDAIAATGYGRHLAKANFNCSVISEIKAFALGARLLTDECRSILDIGGQDTKAISLDVTGNLSKFEMNDKCAAGTGRFLEIMAAALGFSIEEFSKAALSADKAEIINSTCTVFAESEVISLINQGSDRSKVALGIHKSIINKSASLLKRVAPAGDIFFAGGVALNECARTLLAIETGRRVFVPPDPQIVGAVGAALFAVEQEKEKDNKFLQ